MPFASLEILALELILLQETGADAVIPRSEAGTEPFHAVYRRQTCLPQVHAALQADKRRVDAWFSDVQIRYLETEEMLPYDPDQLAFMNINTPEELQKAEKIARLHLDHGFSDKPY
jgi:molybdopterin-guanine dinucleotide biosynthesis protein A